MKQKKEKIFHALIQLLDRDGNQQITSSEFAAQLVLIALGNGKYVQKKNATLLEDMNGWKNAFIECLDKVVFPFFENIDQYVE